MIKDKNHSRGQALVEFALIITVLLMMIFLVIESARILQAWITVQNAARVGARYAITGQFMAPDCAVQGLPKFSNHCDGDDPDLRLASVITETHQGLAGLPLNETSMTFEDESYYDIQVWGVDQFNQLQQNFAGTPGNPVVVRAIYRVPIITPFFRPIISSIPVFGQVTMNNESFGQLGNPTQGQGVPPVLPPIPTPGVTPSPTSTPTATSTNTPGPTPTASITPSSTPTETPDLCGPLFEGSAIEGRDFVLVTGEPNREVTIIDLTTGRTLGTDTFVAVGGHACAGFADFNGPNALNETLVAGHLLLAVSDYGVEDTIWVLPGTPTPSPSPTLENPPTTTPTNTPTITPTPTPSAPYILLIPDCAVTTDVQFNVLGANWPTDESIGLFWEGTINTTVPAGHSGSFNYVWTKSNLTMGTADNPTEYQVRAVSPSHTATAIFQLPCFNVPVPTVVATSTPTPGPADLIVVGPPELLSEPPVVAYEPVDVRVVISNTGGIDVSSQFFVDIYFDPAEIYTDTIPIGFSSGYMAVSSLAGGASRVITMTAQNGFANQPLEHQVYAMVDSLEQAQEDVETNNISTPLAVDYVTPAASPTASPTPDATGTNSVSGVVRSRIVNWVPQARAQVKLIDESTSNVIGQMDTDFTGFYEFLNVPDGSYTVTACVYIDNLAYSGLRVGFPAPQGGVDVYLLEGPCQ